MANVYSLLPNELKLWQNLYNQSLTIDGNESIMQTDGTKQLVLIPMMTYTLISTMLQKLKYLPNQCFNRITIGETPVCGLRPLTQKSPSLMYKLTEILRTMVDGVRKQHILSIRMIFYKKNDINTVYDSYSIVFDYTMTSPNDESTTSIHMIAHIIHQIEYMFNWNDALPNDVELKFVLSTLDQFENQQNRLPSPFHFLNENLTKVYLENETNHLMGRLTTPDGKIWLKFLPSTRQLSGSSINSEDLPTQANLFATTKQKTTEIVESTSPKTKKSTKKSTKSTDSNKSAPKKKTGFLSAVKSFITPSRNSTPLTSSTPNVTDLVLIKHTSTPKPGETASRITIGNNKEAPTLSAIYEVSSPDARPPGNISSPTPSTITATDISSATTPVIGIERRSTVRGQAAIARKKIAAMQIRDGEDDDNDGDDDDDDDDDEEQFKKLFSRSKPKKSKTMAVVPTKKSDDVSDVSSISSPISNAEFIFTPPTARKRPTTDRTGDDDLAAEHGTPPKTPRTGRRNRIDDQTSIQATSMDTSDLPVNIDSPRLLRSITKKLQQQASAKKQLEYEEETMTLDQSKTQETIRDEEEMNRAYVQLERSSMALHYSMDESD
ncbi:unnamed protein product [Adineta steineri]|uniref:HORMA domain-containing protein n=3 Tax=Adineta steineri TaxID=433720 RepID=A0A814ICE8_9BILA|nr:unnamed protein product [Adineta steineri]CAF1067138.1 unnamed protein product [Adineta steineri]CAF3543420.1 unnamed protein product [Adineta steineri]CAF3728762.1 unnamed protein product [Adineta steineri]